MTLFKKRFAAVCSCLIFMAPAVVTAQGVVDNSGTSGIKYVANSYIVKFKETRADEVRTVWRAKELADHERKLGAFGTTMTKFGEHSSGQDKAELQVSLNIQGTVVHIYDNLNMVHVAMDEKEADKLSQDQRVEWVHRESIPTLFDVQTPVGWGLDRLDEVSVTLDSSFTYNMTGAGQNIVVLDSGLNLGTPAVNAEFGTRAQLLADFNAGGTGQDCHTNGHGTAVASLAGGNTYGVAKGVNIWIVKILAVPDCTVPMESAIIASFNWLGANAPIGTIINWSGGYGYGPGVCVPEIVPQVESAISYAYSKGMIIVVAAGNDGCNVNLFTPTHMAEVFSVGATTSNRFSVGQDAKWSGSRIGAGISGFAPGGLVESLSNDGGVRLYNSGTSFAAPYVAGVFALACQALSTDAVNCNNSLDTSMKYNALRDGALMGTVVNTDGSAFTDGTVSRFIVQRW